MRKKQCLLCGRERASLDEHIETHHNKYDFYQLLYAIVAIFEKDRDNMVLSVVRRVQRENMKRLRQRSKNMIAR